jgi:hypothetical protein
MSSASLPVPKALSTLLFQLWDVNSPTISQAMYLLPASCCLAKQDSPFCEAQIPLQNPQRILVPKNDDACIPAQGSCRNIACEWVEMNSRSKKHYLLRFPAMSLLGYV